MCITGDRPRPEGKAVIIFAQQDSIIDTPQGTDSGHDN
jgi:hypothetical protein